MRPRAQSKRRIEAFTILEVALAATALLLAIAGTAQVIMSGAAMLDMSRKQTIAAQIIHTEIDQVHLCDWSTVNNWNGTSATISVDTLSSSDATSASRFGYPELLSLKNVAKGFTMVRTVTSVGSRSDMVAVQFTITWKADMTTGKSFSRSGTTYFGKNGLSLTYQRP